MDAPVVSHLRERHPYEIVPGESGDAALRLGGTTYSVPQVLALILREVRELAQDELGAKVSRAVITVPAYFSDVQRGVIREAGRLAGLHVERLINEPTAAAIAYAAGRSLAQRVLIYDLGGGTFDASVLELSPNVYEVLCTGGDDFLGGSDFDAVIVRHLTSKLGDGVAAAIARDVVAQQRLLDAAERAKQALSEQGLTRVQVPFIAQVAGAPADLDLPLTRPELDALTGDLVDRSLRVCTAVLGTRSLALSDIDEVVVVGGQSRATLVQAKLEHLFKRTPSRAVHPNEAIAVGAALFADGLGRVAAVSLIDVLSRTIGVMLPGGRFHPVLSRNTPLPAKRRYVVTTSRDGQASLELSIHQGESEWAERNECLGILTLDDLPPGPRGAVSVEVTFEVSTECVLTVVARESSRSGRAVTSRFATSRSAAGESPDPGPGGDRPRTLNDWVRRLIRGA